MKKTLFLFAFVLLTACLPERHKGMDDGLYAELQTNKGNILLELYFEDVPMTVSNFVSLADGTNKNVKPSLRGNKFYNGIRFHRVVKNFVIQAGDKSETGSGGPGYVFGDEFPEDENGKLKYSHDGTGILSMANPGKNANGSQFFITYKPTTYLDRKHSVFGKIVLNGKQIKALKSKNLDSSLYKSAVDSLRMEVMNKIEQFDTIKKVDFIKIGSKAKEFDAAEVFDVALTKFRIEAKERRAKEKKAEEERYAKYLKDRDEYLQKNGFDKLKATATGLKVKRLARTSRPLIPKDKLVKCHFTLCTADGKKIQSTLDGGTPFVFKLDDASKPLLPGFKEGVAQLREKEKAMLYIPYEIGFGAKKYGPFPAKSDLVFEIEILEIGK